MKLGVIDRNNLFKYANRIEYSLTASMGKLNTLTQRIDKVLYYLWTSFDCEIFAFVRYPRYLLHFLEPWRYHRSHWKYISTSGYTRHCSLCIYFYKFLTLISILTTGCKYTCGSKHLRSFLPLRLPGIQWNPMARNPKLIQWLQFPRISFSKKYSKSTYSF